VVLSLLLKPTALGAIVVGDHLTVKDPPESPDAGGGHWVVLIEDKVALIDPLWGVVTDPLHPENVTLTDAFSDTYGAAVFSAGLKDTEPLAPVQETVPVACVGPLAEAIPTPVRATVPNDNDKAAPAIMNFRLSFT
jgi:hypothetical protein